MRQANPAISRGAIAVPIAVLVLIAPDLLRTEWSTYDGGLYLTLSRFVGPEHLPYRDLWTLYGPGPPLVGSAVMHLFGPGIGPQIVIHLLLHVATVAAVYLVARRFVPAWVAAIFAALPAAVTYSLHFQYTLALLLWAVWLVLRAGQRDSPASGHLVGASLLFGLSFWGRFEFVLVGIAAALALWLWTRGAVPQRARRGILLAGLGPPTAFLVYLVAFGGGDRVWLNLVEYPLLRYPDDVCRGLPDQWPRAVGMLLTGFPWGMGELVLWTGTLLAPALGAACIVLAARRWRGSIHWLAVGAVGAITLIVWLEHRPRASATPNPLMPLVVVAACMVIGALASRRARAALVASVLSTAVIVVALLVGTVPHYLPAWTGWPDHHPMLGWEGGRFEGLYDEGVWSEVRREVRSRAGPGEEIFVALSDNSTRHHANAPVFYWYTDRPPASRFIEFDPCLTDTEPVQREIVRDIAGVDVVVATTFFPDPGVPGSGTLDGYLSANYEPVYRGDLPRGQAVEVLERVGAR